MTLDNSPIIYYSLLASAMTVCLYLFVSIKVELRRMNKKLSDRLYTAKSESSRIGAHAAALESKLANWANRIKSLEDHIELFSQSRHDASPRSGIDLNQRTQVMRRAKRGERPEQIAYELGVPKNEVELLVKVHRAVVRAF